MPRGGPDAVYRTRNPNTLNRSTHDDDVIGEFPERAVLVEAAARYHPETGNVMELQGVARREARGDVDIEYLVDRRCNMRTRSICYDVRGLWDITRRKARKDTRYHFMLPLHHDKQGDVTHTDIRGNGTTTATVTSRACPFDYTDAYGYSHCLRLSESTTEGTI